MNPAQLPSLAWFALIARHRSLSRAAAEAGISKAALSQSLKALEHQLDTRLLNRTTRTMSLTEEGQRLLDALLPSLNHIDTALQSLTDARSEPSGVLKINTSRLAARLLIEPYLLEFHRTYPKLRLELIMDEGLADIVADGADAGIRLGRNLAPHMIAIPISAPIHLLVVGSPEYLSRNGVPLMPADLAQHQCLGLRNMTQGSLYSWEFKTPDDQQSSGDIELRPEGCMISNDDAFLLQATLQGVGLMQQISLAIQAPLREGRLVNVLKEWNKPLAGFYLYLPSREHMAKKMRVLIDFLKSKHV